MNTITKQTIAQLARVHELRRIELKAEGWTAKRCPAVSPEWLAKLTWVNGSTHTLTLPVARLHHWAKMSKDGEFAVTFDGDNTIQLQDGTATLRLRNQPEGPATPHFTLDGDTNFPEYVLPGATDALDKLATARATAKSQKELAKVARLRGIERQAMLRLKEAAHTHCERVTFLASMTFEQALTDARAFRDARRFVRTTLARFEYYPEWLSKETPPTTPEGWQQASEADQYTEAIRDFNMAHAHLLAYKPRKSWSRSCAYQTEKRTEDVNRSKSSLLMVLRSAMARHLGGQAKVYDERKPGDAAYGWNMGKYARERQFVRGWAQDKARLASDYRAARDERILAQSKLS